nr:malate dehydrogenase [Desulfurococcales archaeon]
VFRGVLDVRAKSISDEMLIAAAEELARYAEERGLREDYIIPKMEEWEVYPRVAAATASKAVEQGLARVPLTYKEELEHARAIIEESRRKLEALWRAGLIREPPGV